MSILATDNFNRANGNLGTGNWSTASVNAGSIQITSDAITPNCNSPQRDAQFWNALSFPNDQSSQVTLGAVVAGSFGIGPAVRVSTAGGGTFYQLLAFSNSLYQFGSVVSQVATTHNISVVPQPGDVVKLVTQGTTLTCFVNGVNIYQVTDSTIASGAAGVMGFGISTAHTAGSWIGASLTAPNPTSVSTATGVQGSTNATFTVAGTNFDLSGSTLSFSGIGITVNSYSAQNSTTVTASVTIAGNAPTGAQNVVITNADGQTGALSSAFTVTASAGSNYSVPDCRNYGNFPNNAVNVNGTLIYTVPKTDSRAAGAPVDSRVSKPVACGTYPQNSRKAGTFGPGE